MLGRDYRFVAFNSTGQTLAIAAIVVKVRRWKRNATTGAIEYEASEATALSNAGTLASGVQVAGTHQDNSSLAYEGADVDVSVTAPASSNGTVTILLQNTTAAADSQWPDDATGIRVLTLDFAAAGTGHQTVQI